MQNRDIIVIGASAGGLEAVTGLLAQLPGDLRAAVLVALHVTPSGTGAYARAMDRAGPLPVRLAADLDTIYHGRVYVAPPDRHLVLLPEHVRVARGPKENLSRPAIDPLFRSAAVAYGGRVTGVLLTGYLDDGVAGLAAIKQHGGVAVVQDPGDAEVPDMPSAALDRIEVDHCVPVHRMGAVLMREVARPARPSDNGRDAASLRLESRIAAGEEVEMSEQEKLGEQAGLGCPECGGPLLRVADPAVKRFRCHIGHAYTDRALLADQSEQIERALSAALRTLEERARVLADISSEMETADGVSGDGLARRAAEASEHAETLRQLLIGGAGAREEA